MTPLASINAGLQRIIAAFAIDLRALALFRIALGVMVAADGLMRLRDLGAFHTDSGVIPRALVLAYDPATVSLHLTSGAASGQVLLFGLQMGFAMLLALGYRTRLATALCFALCFSVQQRNPFILQSSDLLISLLLFWSLFLPLGALYSLDRALRPSSGRIGPPDRNPYQFVSVGSAGILLQVMSLYLFTALLKSSPEWQLDRTAVFNAVRGTYATPLGMWLSQFEPLTHGLTLFVWYLEVLAPVLVFCPLGLVPLRLIVLAALYGMHLGFLVCLGVGQFPWLNFTALILFIPGAVWDWVGAKFPCLAVQGKRISHRMSGWLAGFKVSTNPSPDLRRPSPRSEVTAALGLGVMLYANLSSVWTDRYPLPNWLRNTLHHFSLEQNWIMFATVPPLKFWYVVEAVDRHGKTAYMLNALTPWEKNRIPENVNDSYANYRWRKFFSNLWYHHNDPARRALLAYVCRQHPEFAQLSLIYREQDSRIDSEPKEYPLVTNFPCTEYRTTETTPEKAVLAGAPERGGTPVKSAP